MAKNINLTSQEWIDLIFEGKNKSYGAYKLRQSSGKDTFMLLLLSSSLQFCYVLLCL